jgi:AcrR family transcriptional regulator
VDPDTFAEKKQLVDAAIALSQEDPDRLTVANVCATAQLDEATFHTHFEDPGDLRPAFYDLVVPQYHLIRDATTGYEDFSFEERLASFVYILLDTLGEHRAFVQQTFDHRIRYQSSLRRDVRAALRDLFAADDVPDTTQLVTGWWPAHEVMTTVTFSVVRFWIDDDTDEQQATTALVDKLVAFTAELVTFRGVQRGTDLAWYLYQNDVLGLGRLPLIGGWFRKGDADRDA